MNEFLRRAKELEHQMQKDRRYLHQHAEAGEHLPGTTKYVMERLSSIGLSPREICDSGITALIEGSCPGKTILLRADMDALPMKEMNSLPFQTVTEAATTADMTYIPPCFLLLPRFCMSAEMSSAAASS